MKRRKAYIISAVRTTISPVGGSLKDIPVHEMAAKVLHENLKRISIPASEVDNVLLSNALGGGGNIARLCALSAGFPPKVLGSSIDRQCVGGLDAILQAAAEIQNGNANLILAGGVESFSLRPERKYPNSWNEKSISLERPPFFPNDDPTIGLEEFIQPLKKEFGITDKEEFEWAQRSHQKALAFKDVIAAEVHPLNDKGLIDSFSREISWETYQKAKAKFGHSHPCNTAPKADGAAFVAIASEELIQQYKLDYGVEIIDGFTLGGTPEKFPLLPADALKSLLKSNNLTWDDVQQLELMEAYVTQAILCAKLSGAPTEKINPHGGAISRGHPIGASGAVLAVHLFHSLKNKKGLGVAAIAGAGGLASVLLLKTN